MKTAIVFAIVLLSVQSGFADDDTVAKEGGTGLGNGGSLVEKNGKAELADKYYDRDQATTPPVLGKPMDFSTELQRSLGIYRALLSRYSINSSYFWEHVVFGKRIQYRSVDELPCKGTEFGLACNSGTVTYVLEDELKKLSAEQQALEILRARLQVLDTATDSQSRISPFVATLLEITQMRQKQLNGDRSELSEVQMSKLKGLRDQAQALGFELDPMDSLEYLPWGGVLVRRGKVSRNVGIKKSFVGIDSRIENSEVESSEVVDSEVVDSSISESTLRSAEVKNFVIHGSTVLNSEVSDGWERDYDCLRKVEVSAIDHSIVRAHCNTDSSLNVFKSRISKSFIDFGGSMVEAKADACRIYDVQMERNSECLKSILDVIRLKESRQVHDQELEGRWDRESLVTHETALSPERATEFRREMDALERRLPPS